MQPVLIGRKEHVPCGGARAWALATWVILSLCVMHVSTSAASETSTEPRSGNWVTTNLRRWFFVRSPSGNGLDLGTRNESRYLPWRGKQIRRVEVSKIPVFGSPVPDSLAANWIERLGNEVHLNTRDRVIRQQLLFRSGDRLDPFDVADSERILRELPYIEDARIFVAPVDADSNAVDLIVTTRDRWSLGLGLDLDNSDAYSVSAFERNLLGSGLRLDFTYLYDRREDPENGVRFESSVDNIRGSFIRNDSRFEDSFERDELRTTFDRAFRSPRQRQVGGLELRRTEFKQTADSSRVAHEFDQLDTYLGRAFRVAADSSDMAQRTRAIAALRYTDTHFRRRPQVESDSNTTFHDRALTLLGLSLNHLDFYKSQLVFGLGRTEDIPTGYLVSLVTGYENGEFRDRPYGGLTLEMGGYLDDVGYLATSLGLGSFSDAGDFRDGVFRMDVRYFTRLAKLGDVRLRQFVDLSYVGGIKRTIPGELLLGDEHGVRALETSRRGDQRFTANLELVSLMPWQLFGFAFQMFSFADLGLIAPASRNLLEERLYSSVGLGWRLKNEHLVFGALELRVAYVPETPRGDDDWQVQAGTRGEFRLDLMRWKRPSLIDFR